MMSPSYLLVNLAASIHLNLCWSVLKWVLNKLATITREWRAKKGFVYWNTDVLLKGASWLCCPEVKDTSDSAVNCCVVYGSASRDLCGTSFWAVVQPPQYPLVGQSLFRPFIVAVRDRQHLVTPSKVEPPHRCSFSNSKPPRLPAKRLSLMRNETSLSWECLHLLPPISFSALRCCV